MNVWEVQLGDRVRTELSVRMFGVQAKWGKAVAIQRRRNRIEVEWADGLRQWFAARKLTA